MIHSFHSVLHQYLFLTSIFVSSNSGVLGWNVKCQFAEQGKTRYWKGELISGRIEVVNDGHSKSTLKKINAELIGEFSFMRSIYRGSHYRCFHKFFGEEVILPSVIDPKEDLLPFGNYTLPFSFRLDDSLPPSVARINSTSAGVRYFIRIKIKQNGSFKRSIEKDCPVVIQRLSSPKNATQVEKHKKDWRSVDLHVILHKNVVVAGKNFTFDVNLQNPKGLLIRRISATLYQTLSAAHVGDYSDVLPNQDLEGIRAFRGKQFHKSFELPVPRTAAPTCSLYFGSAFKKKPFTVRHELLLTAHIRGLFTNIRLKFPLTVIYTNQTNN